MWGAESCAARRGGLSSGRVRSGAAGQGSAGGETGKLPPQEWQSTTLPNTASVARWVAAPLNRSWGG